jgi:transmembrane sensor
VWDIWSADWAPGVGEEFDALALARYLSGEVGPAEAARIRAWIERDPRRQATVDRLRAAWTAAPLAEFDADDALWRRMSAQLDQPPAPALISPARRVSAPRRVALLSRRRRSWPIAAALVIAAGAAGAWAVAHLVAADRTGSVASHVYATRAGQVATIELADGTHIVLGAASTLRLPNDVEDAQRDVYLEGKAYFVVNHNPARRFVVHSARAVTEDRGTAFSVEDYASDSNAQVLVAAGSVALRSALPIAGRQLVVLTSGQLGRLGRDGTHEVREQIDPAKYLAWTRGRLAFWRAPLSTVGRELTHWYDVDIVIDPRIAGVTISGEYAGDQSVDEVLSLIAHAAGVTYKRVGRSITLQPSGHS